MRKKNLLLLFILPLFTFIISLIRSHFRGPYFLSPNIDPDYIYLFNSLSLRVGNPIGHIDHPGTPLQMFGAILISFISSLRSRSDIVFDVLSHPELYLTVIGTTLSVLFTLCSISIGIFLSIRYHTIRYAILWQIIPLTSLSLLPGGRVVPETFLILSTQGIGLFYILACEKKTPLSHTYSILLFGLLSGFGIATKITFFPVCLPFFFILPSWKKRLLLFESIICSFFLFTIPIIPSYPKLLYWVETLFSHAGIYGSGQKLFVSPLPLLTNLCTIADNNPLLIVLILLLFLTLQKARNHSTVKKLILGFLCSFIIMILMVAKHYGQHYMVPILGLESAVAVILFRVWNTKVEKAALLLLVVLSIITTGKNLYAEIQYSQAVQDSFVSRQKMINSDKKNVPIIYYYRSSSPFYALKFGDDFAKNKYSETLQHMYGDQYFYHIWSKKLEQWSVPIDFNQLKEAYILGTPFINEYKQYEPPVAYSLIWQGTDEALYEIKN